MAPLLAACWAGVAFADRLDGFSQLRHVFKTALIPQLRVLPFWVREGAEAAQQLPTHVCVPHAFAGRQQRGQAAAGAGSSAGPARPPAAQGRRCPPAACLHPAQGLGLLALGAGVGEETLFRAFLQAALCGGIADAAPALPPTAATAAGLAASSVVFGYLHALTPTYFLFATGAGALFGECAAADSLSLIQEAPGCRRRRRCLTGCPLDPLPFLCCRLRVSSVRPAYGGNHALDL